MINIRPEPLANRRCLRSLPIIQEHLNVYFEELLICRALFWDD